MIIRRETLNAVLPATTADDTRYFLDAVLVEPTRHRAIATDGHIMIIATDNSPLADEDFPAIAGAEFHGDPAPIAIPAAIVRSMIATMPKKSSRPILATVQVGQNGSEETATIAATDLQAPRVATIAKDDRRFPAYERVMSVAAPSVKVAIAIDVLETLIKSAKAVCGTGKREKKPIVTFEVPIGAAEVTTAIGFTVSGLDVTVTGVAMPCRI